MAFFNLPSYLHELEIDGVKQNEDDDTQDFSLDNDDQNNENNPPEDNSGGDDDNGEQVDVSGDDEPDDDGEQVDVSGNDDEPDDDYNIPDEPVPDDNPDDGEQVDVSGNDNPDDNGEQVDVSGEDNTSEGEDDSQDNFDISSDDEGDGDGSDDNTNNDEPSQEEPKDNSSEGDSTSAEIGKVEEDIFSVLSPEQQNIRIFELKGNFAKTYDDIEDTLEKINSLTKTSENQSVLERVIKSLNSMKDMIQFYITNTFDTKSYIENSTTYKKYLTALQVISNILKEVDSKGSKE